METKCANRPHYVQTAYVPNANYKFNDHLNTRSNFQPFIIWQANINIIIYTMYTLTGEFLITVTNYRIINYYYFFQTISHDSYLYRYGSFKPSWLSGRIRISFHAFNNKPRLRSLDQQHTFNSKQHLNIINIIVDIIVLNL